MNAELGTHAGRFSSCRSELAREALLARAFSYDAALSSAGTTGCALHGASRVSLRSASLTPALLRGIGLGVPSRRDIHVPSLLARHPCLASPYATPTPGLLKGIRDRGVWMFLNSDSNKALRSFADQKSIRRRRTPLSGGRMESAWRGASGMDAARGLGVPAIKGHGWPFAAGPWSVTGARKPRRSRGRMQGQAFLLTFLGAGLPATEKSESPSRAKPMSRATPLISRTSRSPNLKASRASSLLHGLAAALNCKNAFTSQVPQC